MSSSPQNTPPTDLDGRNETEHAGTFFLALVRRPVALLTIFSTLVVVGLIAYERIPLQLLPSGFAEPGINLWVPNSGASAQENEEQVARVIEEQLRTMSGIESVRSWSDEDDVELSVEFDGSLDLDLAKAEVRDRLERARPLLPDTIKTIGMWSEDADSLPITFFGILLKGDPERRDFLMEKVVVPRLEAVDGIGRVDVWGVLQDNVRIMLDEDKVIAAQLDLGAVIGRLMGDNFALPLGEVNDGGREIILRSDMRFTSAAEIEEFPIGNGLKLKDVGRVAKVKSASEWMSRIDGSFAYYGMATKDSQSNVVETSRNFERTIDELANDPALAGDITILDFFLQGRLIESALSQLRETALWGGALAVVVLFVFLRRVRLTLCVALSIPVSAMLAIVWEYSTGGSFNLLTMTGITLGIGMLVDNAVVVVENIARIRARGETPEYAAAAGTRQIALAVTLATMTTVVVFLPLIFISDNQMVRVMFGGIGIPLAVSLLASLLVAVFFLPVISARLLGERPRSVTRIGTFMAPVLSLPARTIAWLVGALRFAAHATVVGLHRLEGPVLDALRKSRYVLAVLVIALAAWKFAGLGGGTVDREAITDFGLTPNDSAGSARIAVVSTAAFLLALLSPLYFWKRRSLPPARPDHFVPQGASLIELIINGNQRLVAWTLEHRFSACLISVAALLSIAIPATGMKVTPFGQDSSEDDVSFRVNFDADLTLAEASDNVGFYEDFLEAKRDEYGFEHLSVRFNERRAYFAMYFEEAQPMTRIEALSRQLVEEVPRVPGHELRFYDENESNKTTNSVVQFTLRGPDSEELERLGLQAAALLEDVPGLSEVDNPMESAPDQIQVMIDRELAHDYGVTTEGVQQTISYTLRGFSLPRFQEEGRDIPLLIEYDEDEVAGVPTLRDLGIGTGSGTVALSTFAELAFGKGSRGIYRKDGQTSFTLEAKVEDPLQVIPVTERAYLALSAMDLPRGYTFARDDSAMARQEEEFSELGKAFWLSVVLVFLLMGILFESVVLPFSVLFTVPFAILGSFWTLFLTRTPMDSMGYIGIIILAGVVVNNGIVLIDRIHNLRAIESDRRRAVLEGCSQRVRPVLMTALTTVCGLLPMILAEPPSNGVDYRTLGTIVAGGLVSSTFFTLWVVPLAYTLIDDFAVAVKRHVRWFLGKLAGRLPGELEPA